MFGGYWLDSAVAVVAGLVGAIVGIGIEGVVLLWHDGKIKIKSRPRNKKEAFFMNTVHHLSRMQGCQAKGKYVDLFYIKNSANCLLL